MRSSWTDPARGGVGPGRGSRGRLVAVALLAALLLLAPRPDVTGALLTDTTQVTTTVSTVSQFPSTAPDPGTPTPPDASPAAAPSSAPDAG